MAKLVYLVHCPASLDIPGFRAQILDNLAPRLLEQNPLGLKISLSDPRLRRPLWLPTEHAGLALLSIWTHDDNEEAAWTALVGSLGLPTMGYRVSASTALSYDRTWADGEDSPGVAMLTLFRRRRGLGRDEFVRRWHEGHSPYALRFHPMWNYLRNVVEEPLSEGADPWGGIVEEHYRSIDDVTDPRRFFRGVWHIMPRLAATLWQTHAFLDLFTLKNYLLVERWLRTPER